MIRVNGKIVRVANGELPKLLHGILSIAGDSVLGWDDRGKDSPQLRAGTLLKLEQIGDVPRGLWITHMDNGVLRIHNLSGTIRNNELNAILEDISMNDYSRHDLIDTIDTLRLL